MNVKALENALALDHVRRRAHPPLNRSRRRRARKIMKIAAEFYAGKRVPSQRTREVARVITREAERASRRWMS
jgi:hypothetical protein